MHPAGINTAPSIDRHIRRLQRVQSSLQNDIPADKRERLSAEADQIKAILSALANDIKAVL